MVHLYYLLFEIKYKIQLQKIMKLVPIYHMSGDIFQEIQYTDFDELCYKLELIIVSYDADILIQLLINNEFLNNFDNIDITILSKINEYKYISVIFSKKKELYYLGNDYGKYILNFKDDNYSKILTRIINFYNIYSHDIIIDNSYKDLVLEAVKVDGLALEFAGIDLQNDKEIVLAAIKQYGGSLEFASNNLQNDKEIVLVAVKESGIALEFASIDLQNNKEIVLEAIKNEKYSFRYASSYLRNNKEIIAAYI